MVFAGIAIGPVHLVRPTAHLSCTVGTTGQVGGSVIGGLIGGFIVYYTTGWRWLLWTVAIAAGTVTFAGMFFLQETYAPYLLEKKAMVLRKANPEIEYRTIFTMSNRT